MSINILSQFLSFLAYLAFHIFIGRKLLLGQWVFSYVYIGFLLTFPPHISKSRFLFLGFAVGLLIDLFEYSPGIHAFACVFLAFVRPYLLSLLAARNNIDEEELREISIREMSLLSFIFYAFTLIFLHHLLVFFLEAWTSKLIGLSLQKTIFSSIFTLVLVILIQYLFFTSRKR
ncbi:MAG: hypothetical protein OHK0045_20710 [Raineya sp.]